MSTEKKPLSPNALAAALATCSLAVLSAASVAHLIAPNGSMARLTGWTFMGLSKDSWEALDTWFGFLVILSGLLYVVVHRRLLLGYLKTEGARPSREVGMALVVAVILAAGSVGDVEPFAALMRWHETHKHSGMARAATRVHASAGRAGSHSGCGGGACGEHEGHVGCDGGGCDRDNSHGSCSGGACDGHGHGTQAHR